MNSPVDLHHFILTRFNLLIWKKDKERNTVRPDKWLDYRFYLFKSIAYHL